MWERFKSSYLVWSGLYIPHIFGYCCIKRFVGLLNNHLSIYSCLQAIRRTIDKKTVEVYQLFNEELNLVKKEFNTKTVDLPPMYPHYAGSAAWARMLKRRIDRPMNVRS